MIYMQVRKFTKFIVLIRIDELHITDDLPRSLKILIISGNPCCENSELLSMIQTRLSGVEVIAESSTAHLKENDGKSSGDKDMTGMLAESMAAVYADDATHERADKRRDGSEEKWDKGYPEDVDPSTDEVEAREKSEDAEYTVLDADAILKQIVNRKCEMEGIEHFDLKHTMTVRLCNALVTQFLITWFPSRC